MSPPLTPPPVSSVQASGLFAAVAMATVTSTPGGLLPRVFPAPPYLPSPIMAPLLVPEQTEPLDLTVGGRGPERATSADSALDLSGRHSEGESSPEDPATSDIDSSFTSDQASRKRTQVSETYHN